MPHMKDSPADQWRTLLTNAHQRRINARCIVDAVKELASTAPASPDDIVDILLSLRSGQIYDKDPLVLKYAEAFLESGCIVPTSFLLGMLSTSFIHKANVVPPPNSVPLPTFEEKGFRLVIETLNGRLSSASSLKMHGIVYAITMWLHTVSGHEMLQQIELGALHTVSTTILSMYEALGLLAYTVLGHEHFKNVEQQPWWKIRRVQIVDELVKFDVNVLQMCHSQLAGHLQALTKARPFLETDADGRPTLTREIVFSTVSDVPSARSRGGLFIWLTSVLYAQPWLDDSSIRSYVLVRYHDDTQRAALSLVMAAYDVLVNSASGISQLQKRARSFICNRLPILLLSLVSAMPAGGVDNCISMVLASVDLGPVSPLGSTSAETKEMIKKSKLQFLQCCVLHGVLSEPTAAAILPDQSFTALKGQRYTKAGLYNQCISNVTRLDTLIPELDTNNGNAITIAKCIAELLTTLCGNKDTMTLKSVCSILLKKLPLMEHVFQYVAPAEITLPLCHLLNEWTHDQDQTEYQPPYEEFAVILLLLSAIVHTQDLNRQALQLDNSDDFATKVLFGSVGNVGTSDLTDEQNKQLSHWIQGLYATDEHGETIGITDEVYSQCPPQAFYLLVPILFEQTVLACKSKALDVSAMKGGLEFLLEPFLLPSLIGGLSWVADTTWIDAEDTTIRLSILDKLLKSSSTSQDVQTMHKTILSIVAKPLEASLLTLIEARPEKKKEVTKLLDILRPQLSRSKPLAQNTQSQLAAWTSESDLAAGIRGAVTDVLAWTNNGNTGAGSSYTPCAIWQAISILGSRQVVDALVAEVQHQTTSGDVSTVLDLCTAVVCSPMPSSQRAAHQVVDVNSLTLVDHVRFITSDVDALLSMPFTVAEAFVRLSRSVEAQVLSSTLASQLNLVNMSLPSDADQVMQDLGLTADSTSLDVAAAAVIDSGLDASFDNNAFSLDNDTALDLKTGIPDLTDTGLMNIEQDNIFDINMDLGSADGLLVGNGVSDLGMNADDDIFGDLAAIGGDYDYS